MVANIKIVLRNFGRPFGVTAGRGFLFRSHHLLVDEGVGDESAVPEAFEHRTATARWKLVVKDHVVFFLLCQRRRFLCQVQLLG